MKEMLKIEHMSYYMKNSVLPVLIFFIKVWVTFGVFWLIGEKAWDYWQALDTTTQAYQSIVNNTPQFIFELTKRAIDNPLGWITSNTLIITTLAVLGKPR